jgi:hypothetical protein
MAVEAVYRELVSDFPAIREKYRDILVYCDPFLKAFRLFFKQIAG